MANKKTLATPELRRRRRLTWKEGLRAHMPFVVLGSSVPLIGTSVGVDIVADDFANSFFSAGAFTWGLINLFWGVLWVGVPAKPENIVTISLSDRRKYVMLDRQRKARPHRNDEGERLQDVEYPRYSVGVEPAGRKIRVMVLAHQRMSAWPLLRWRAAATKKLYDTTEQHWGEQSIKWHDLDPEPSELLHALAVAEDNARALEKAAYADAVAKYQVECVATAMQPPPASAATRARLEIMKYDVEMLLEEAKLDDDEPLESKPEQQPSVTPLRPKDSSYYTWEKKYE